MPVVPRLIAWEVTRRCNLHCRHCRASAANGPYAGELTLAEARALVDDIASFAKSILILTGGEPLLCPWLWDIIAHAREKGLKPVLGTNATLVDDKVAERIAASGVPRISVSIDFPTAKAHDAFRGDAGAFDAAIRGIAAVRRAGVEVQVNTTVTRLNRHLLPQLHDLAVSLGVQAFHPFLLVPTGRGADLAGVELSSAEYEETLLWVYRTQKASPLQFKPTDAPQYQRIVRQQCAAEGCALPVGGPGMNAASKGCMAGTGFCFVSHVGDVQPCGYFDMKVGNVRNRLFSELWAESPVFDDLRHPERLKGKCGVCSYKTVCGGCRARALARTGDYLAQEPYCAHVPDRMVLDRIQRGFPVEERPYASMGAELGLSEADCLARIRSLRDRGLVRRVGAFFDARKLGYVSTLVAFAVSPDRLDAVAARVGERDEVTHNYSRHGRYNLWFTLIARSRSDVDAILAGLKRLDGVGDVLELPAHKTYKLRVTFVRGESDASALRSDVTAPFNPDASDEIELVRRLQGDVLDRGLCPFDGLSLSRVRDLMANGTIRRFGAVVNHRNVGYVANALTAWQVPDDRLDAVGAALAKSAAVSHCYARVTRPEWPYGVYAMVHARSQAELDACCLDLTRTVGEIVGHPVEPLELETLREYKKTSMQYFSR